MITINMDDWLFSVVVTPFLFVGAILFLLMIMVFIVLTPFYKFFRWLLGLRV